MLHRLIAQGDRVPSNLPVDGHSFRRLEVLTGTPRRRHWSNAQKAAIVAESLTPGVRTSEIALRHGLHRNQLYEWWRKTKAVWIPGRSRSRLAARPCGLGRGSSLAFLARCCAC